jgi:hypothetical protein
MEQIMKSMTRALLYLSCCGALWCADLAGVKSVYVLPMPHGLDQYLANRLTNEHDFQIVTDAKLADAVLTDRIGANLQAQLSELLPAPPEKVEPKADEKTDDKDAKKSGSSIAEAMSKSGGRPMISSVGASKGTVFLVDTQSRQVVWSVFAPAKDSSSKELDRTASDIVSRIMKDLSPKKK